MFAASKTDSASTGGYQISRSLRFNSADSAYLNRTPASATNRTTWTWSAWVKRGSLGTTQIIFVGAQDASNYTNLYFSGSVTDNLELYTTLGGGNYYTTSVFRDPSAWYHIVYSVDTTQATAANRVKIYVNNVLQPTTVSVAISQNTNTYVNSANPHYLGRNAPSSQYFDGYMTEVNFIDGQALTPSSFGQTDAQTGVWTPIAYSGSYGTNGFYLNFSDNSNTTAATLGKDYSGNGNNWTPNNFSVTAGAGNDSLVDSPTSYGTDTDVGGTVRGNYCTFNPVLQNNFWASVNRATLTNGNLDAGTGNTAAFGTFEIPTDVKVYFEITWTDVGAISAVNLAASDRNVFELNYLNDGRKQLTGIVNSAYGASWTSGDIIGVAVDRANNTATFYKNGTSQGAISNTFPSVPIFGGVYIGGTVGCTANFGQRPFAYTSPSGFKALCTQNFPTPTIGATTATLANKYFDIVLRTGSGGATYSTTVNMANGALVWDKPRNQASSHFWFDSVRGIANRFSSNSTNAETSSPTWYTNFGTNSYTTGADDWGSPTTLVDWIWAAGAGASNTSGSITSTVGASATSGFSIVTYTGTGLAGTIGHGLGVAPAMIIVKSRSATGDWPVYHTSIGNSSSLFLNLTNASTSSSTIWNATSPTSSVFSVGINTNSNTITVTYVAYCFAPIAGYSAFGSYTGNGSADGPFIYTGFRPAFVMFKVTSTSDEWRIYDEDRLGYNTVANILVPNASDAEAVTGNPVDILSNGFKVRGSGASINGSGETYIYMAFASNPFKYSLAR